jgi:hypothetical protein
MAGAAAEGTIRVLRERLGERRGPAFRSKCLWIIVKPAISVGVELRPCEFRTLRDRRAADLGRFGDFPELDVNRWIEAESLRDHSVGVLQFGSISWGGLPAIEDRLDLVDELAMLLRVLGQQVQIVREG